MAKAMMRLYNRQHPAGFRWLHEHFGTNWRMMEMQAVIGRLQLRQMSDWTTKRQLHAERLAALLGRYACVRLVKTPDHMQHAQYKFYVFVRPENFHQAGLVTVSRQKSLPRVTLAYKEVVLKFIWKKLSITPSMATLKAFASCG